MVKNFLSPGLDQASSDKIVDILLSCLAHEEEGSLVLKHAHWNVAGPSFIGVHEMLDPEVDSVRNMADETAERIATLGGAAEGGADFILSRRNWKPFELKGRQDTQDYLKALVDYYAEFIVAERNAITQLDDLDVISSNIIQDHVQELEHFNWFMNSHLIK
ncbi:Dps family protein [Bifidobacterium bombi]|uniref:DNA-binding ferritin family protein n=1 Tax=Bifidobacterium bombi DSM 19703 TaxID=1341695 RepID=A0A080N3J3_9BIFI|nr:DNA starvation/stationary phase protection protein [Bifidobacterium bombi]KFF31743.1 DNA-binding ferritin family protein [Bifidobacterium bombi DSM 19703]